MTILNRNVNLLNLLDIRITPYILPHFTKFNLLDQNKNNISVINDWVYSNLRGRYCISREITIDEDDRLGEYYSIGFEDPRELTMFLLSMGSKNII